MKGVEAIIFDLGRVVIHLDESRTIQEFLAIGNISTEELRIAYSKYEFFHHFERGEIGEEEFHAHMRSLLRNDTLGSEEINKAWNAMLGAIDKSLINQIKEIKSDLPVFVLSNTNVIHERGFNLILNKSTGHATLYEIFDQVYLSQDIGMRKPEPRSWEHILKEQNISSPKSVLFLDDREDNIEAAKAIGLQAIQIDSPYHTSEILKELRTYY